MLATRRIVLSWGGTLKYAFYIEETILVVGFVTFCLSIASAAQTVTGRAAYPQTAEWNRGKAFTPLKTPFFWEAAMPAASVLSSALILTPFWAIISSFLLTLCWVFFMVLWYTCAFWQFYKTPMCDTDEFWEPNPHHRLYGFGDDGPTWTWYNVNVTKLTFRIIMIILHLAYLLFAVMVFRMQRRRNTKRVKSVVAEPPTYTVSTQRRWYDAPPTSNGSIASSNGPEDCYKRFIAQEMQPVDVEYGLDSTTVDGPIRYTKDLMACESDDSLNKK